MSARLLIMGPPGAGKGTQAAHLAELCGVVAISTGEIFRDHIARGTELGRTVKGIVDRGDYVPDDLTNELVADRLEQADAAEGFLLDGYPRTVEQVRFLDGLLTGEGRELSAVVRLVADEDELVSRLLRRAAEQGRSDDSEAAVRHRLEVYSAETRPVLDLYRERGVLIEVDGLGTIDEVRGRVSEALADRGLATADAVASD